MPTHRYLDHCLNSRWRSRANKIPWIIVLLYFGVEDIRVVHNRPEYTATKGEKLLAHCPFHVDTRPSMACVEGRVNCYSCGAARGGVANFIATLYKSRGKTLRSAQLRAIIKDLEFVSHQHG